MQDEIMLAKSCLLEKSDDSMNSSMTSVIRLLDQTYQRLLCDENNKTNNNDEAVVVSNDKLSNVKQTNDLSRSSSKDENLVTVYKEQQPPKHNQSNDIVNGESKHAPMSQPVNVTNIVNGTTRPTPNLQNVTINDDIGSSLQNEISSASSSSILSSSLSSSRASIKHVSNKKVDFIFDSQIFKKHFFCIINVFKLPLND